MRTGWKLCYNPAIIHAGVETLRNQLQEAQQEWTGISKKFEELLRTDPQIQQKLKAALESYTGEQTEEAVFENVLVPLAAEYGLSATYPEFKAYIESLNNQEMSRDELMQVSGGGKGKGVGSASCAVIGAGAGAGAGSKNADICFIVGVGFGAYHCSGDGESSMPSSPID